MNASANKSPNKIPAKLPGTQVATPASASKKPDLAASTKKGATLKVVSNPKESVSASVPMSSGVAGEPKKRGRKSAKESAAVDSRPGSAPPSGRKAAGKKSGAAQVLDPTSFQTYIYRVLKEVKPELGISKKGIALINNIIAELFIKIMQDARNLMIFSKKQTLSSKEIETSVKLHFPGELQKLAVQTCRASVQKFADNTAA